MRLSELAEEVLVATRLPRAEDHSGVDAELEAVAGEVQSLLAESDGRLASEFERIVLRRAADRPLDLRAASLAGWLRAEIQVEQLEEARAMAGLPKEEARRRLTVGFRGRSRQSTARAGVTEGHGSRALSTAAELRVPEEG